MSKSSKIIVDQLRQLVSTPSVSSTDPGWDQGNRAVIDLLAGWLEAMAFNVEIQPVTPGGARPTSSPHAAVVPGGWCSPGIQIRFLLTRAAGRATPSVSQSGITDCMV